MVDDTTLAVSALEGPIDGFSAVLRLALRVTIDPSVFDPAHLEPPAWIAEYKAGMK